MKQIITNVVLLSVLLVSCDKNSEITSFDQNSKGLVKEVEFVVEDPNEEEITRGLTYTGSGVPFAWALNDTVGIFPDKGDQISFSMANGVGTTTAKLDGGAWALKADAQYAAYSPFNRMNFFSTRQKIMLDYTGQVETGIATTDHLGAYDFQAAPFTSADGGKLTFLFKRLSCILILRLTVPQAGTYTNVSVKAEENAFTTKAKLSLGETYTFTPETKSNTISLALKDVKTTTANQVTDLLMMVAPFDLTGKNIEVSLKGANGYLYKATYTVPKPYNANDIKRISLTLKLDSSSNVSFGGEFETEEKPL